MDPFADYIFMTFISFIVWFSIEDNFPCCYSFLSNGPFLIHFNGRSSRLGQGFLSTDFIPPSVSSTLSRSHGHFVSALFLSFSFTVPIPFLRFFDSFSFNQTLCFQYPSFPSLFPQALCLSELRLVSPMDFFSTTLFLFTFFFPGLLLFPVPHFIRFVVSFSILASFVDV